ncbi:hypothetical protein [Ottowia sp. oral taxon 894]|uniref:hypothetical protein n=1 Tax=Ottowia sp. oral taxon 894 TaxID=1658672 RepID=UPI00155DA329|nr:hypothetical protein [Ottowia sp. oral taxon 894]
MRISKNPVLPIKARECTERALRLGKEIRTPVPVCPRGAARSGKSEPQAGLGMRFSGSRSQPAARERAQMAGANGGRSGHAGKGKKRMKSLGKELNQLLDS